jgi:hypothetical protein
VRVFADGSAIAVSVWGVFIADRLGAFAGRTPLSIVAGLGAAVGLVSLVIWLAGPRALRRERYLVLVPLFAVAPVSLLSLHYLGSTLVVVYFSSAVGFGAAIATGLAWSGRHPPRSGQPD